MGKRWIKAISAASLTITSLFTSILAFAQDKGLDVNVDINKGGSQWYAQPWAWIIGAAIFILLLVAIVRGGRTSD